MADMDEPVRRKLLRKQYEMTFDWALKHYERRNNQVLLYQTISGALFAAIGFVTPLLPLRPSLWLLIEGTIVIALSFFGTLVANTLEDSINNAKHLQGLTNAHLVRLELELYGGATRGFYSRIVAENEFSQAFLHREANDMLATLPKVVDPDAGKKGDTIYDLQALAANLKKAWCVAGNLGVSMALAGLALVLMPSWDGQFMYWLSHKP